MGIIAKAISKRQAAPESGPLVTGLQPGLPWLSNEYIVVGALIRWATLRLAVAGSKSYGAQSTVSLFSPTFASNLWCETLGMASWRFHLGIANGGRITPDWVLDLSIKDATATVATPSYQTIEGKMVHSNLHGELREQLLTALALGAPDAGSIEAEASTRAFTVKVVPLNSSLPSISGPVQIRAHIPIKDVAARLRLVGLPVISWSEDSWTWLLGLDADSRRNVVRLHAEPDGDATLLAGELIVDDEAPPLRRRVACAAASIWLGRAELVLRKADPALEFRGPALTPGGE